MCKEDIRLARAAVPGDQKFVGTVNPDVLMLKANSERYSVMAAIDEINAGDTNAVMVYAKSGARVFPLIGLSADHPAGVVSLVDVGNIICEEIWGHLISNTDDPSLYVAETRWDRTQEEI